MGYENHWILVWHNPPKTYIGIDKLFIFKVGKKGNMCKLKIVISLNIVQYMAQLLSNVYIFNYLLANVHSPRHTLSFFIISIVCCIFFCNFIIYLMYIFLYMFPQGNILNVKWRNLTLYLSHLFYIRTKVRSYKNNKRISYFI